MEPSFSTGSSKTPPPHSPCRCCFSRWCTMTIRAGRSSFLHQPTASSDRRACPFGRTGQAAVVLDAILTVVRPNGVIRDDGGTQSRFHTDPPP